MDNRLTEFMYSVSSAMRRSPDVQQWLIESLNPNLAHIMSDRGYASGWNPVALFGIQRVLWLLFKADYAYFFDAPNWMLRCEGTMNVLGLTRLLIGFHKFENYRSWYRERLSDFVADTLLDRCTLERPFFNRAFLQRAVDDHTSGKRDYRNHLSKALTLELIMRRLIEFEQPAERPHSSPFLSHEPSIRIASQSSR